MRKQNFKLFIAAVFILLIALFPVFSTQTVYAAGSFKMETDNVTLDSVYYDKEEGWVYGTTVYAEEDTCAIEGIKLDDDAKKIVTVDYDLDHITIYGKKEGTGKITVFGEDAHNDTVTVTVTKNYMNQKLGAQTSLKPAPWYGTTKLKIGTWPNSDITCVIGADTYKVKSDKDGIAFVSLKKMYKINTKIRYTVTNSGYSASKTWNFYNYTYIDKAAAKKKTVKVKFYNIHKGDVLKLKYGKKTYTKKVTKNYNNKYKVVAFRLKTRVKPKKTFTVKVSNKYKQPMYKVKFKTRKGTSKCSWLSYREY